MSATSTTSDAPLSYTSTMVQSVAKLINAIDIKSVVYPLLGIVAFCLLWSLAASRIDTSLGQFPGPTQVYSQAIVLVDEHQAERVKETAFYQRQEKRNAKKLEKNPDAVVKIRKYTGKETFFDQILTSLKTVMFGFLVASLIAIPVGIACGLSYTNIQTGVSIGMVAVNNHGCKCYLCF